MKFWKHIIQTHLLAAILIIMAGLFAVFSMWDDSSVRDEMPHIVSGYSYLTKQDYRVNPEHPPLIKQLAAFPLLFQDVFFPEQDPSWKDKVNDQWDLGDKFLYKYGNDADSMLFWGRIPMVLIFLLAGWVLYRFTEKVTKRREAALIALLLFLFSPNLMAHGRFITTDMGITAFAIFALYAYYLYLERPNWKNMLFAGVVFGLAQLAKFSVFLLIPTFLFIGFLYGLGVYKKGKGRLAIKQIGVQIGKAILIMVIGYVLVGFWYTVSIWNMPVEVQHKLINESLTPRDLGGINAPYFLNAMTDFPLTRPYAQYLLGFLMVTAHATGGHTTYFFGEVGKHWSEYFVFAYFLKEPVAAQILFYFAVIIFALACFKVVKARKKGEEHPLKNAYWLQSQAVLLGYFFFTFLVFAMASLNKLQLGIRYILPVFPFIYLFSAYMLVVFWEHFEAKKQVWVKFLSIGSLLLLLVWYLGSNILVFPSYLAYFNELRGGPKEGYKYLVDSNLDWGQDLVRLRQFMDDRGVPYVKIDYFGGGNLDYYLGGRYQPWGFDRKPTTGWFAISASAIQWNSLNSPSEGSYHWLTDYYKPVAQIGYSIFVYYVPEN